MDFKIKLYIFQFNSTVYSNNTFTKVWYYEKYQIFCIKLKILNIYHGVRSRSLSTNVVFCLKLSQKRFEMYRQVKKKDTVHLGR